jgi:PAS domain S-box-containing protein
MADAAEPFEALWCTAIVEQACEAIVCVDLTGTIRIWNRGAQDVFGFSAKDALGHSLDLIIPERFRQAHWAGFERAIANGRTRLGSQVRTTRALHKDGRKLYVDLSFGLITAPDGKVVGALGVGREGSARYLAESELRSRVAALEEELARCRAGPAS